MKLLLLFASLLAGISAQSCSSTLTPGNYAAPQIANGYSAHLLVNDLTRPRQIVVDDQGHLIISGDTNGIVILTLSADGCSVASRKYLVPGGTTNYNHGLQLSPDGQTLYASTASSVFSWDYSSSTLTASNRREIISGMNSGGHVTRTLLIPPSHPDLLLISRGSDGNLDMPTVDPSSGRSMIKVFNLTTITTAVNFNTGGRILGWGLRNSVGLAQHPDGGIWSVENSADSIRRYNTDFHQNNPGEELNYHGFLNGSLPEVGPNYGYPLCLAAYDPAAVPQASGLQYGQQFALTPNASFVDSTCASNFVAPRLTFHAHTAPLGMTFNGSETLYIAFHGSWNRDTPVGYNVYAVQYQNGQPVQTANTKDPGTRILWNNNMSACPSGCFRPTNVVLGRRGELYVNGDSNGDIWVLRSTGSREGDNGDEESIGRRMAEVEKMMGAAAGVMVAMYGAV